MTKQAQTQFQLQMEEWLDFAWANRNNPDFKTPQTPRWNATANGLIGSCASSRKTNVPTGSKSKYIINTYALYCAWKEESIVIKESSRQHCFLLYTDAIPELHTFLDFMKDVQSESGYDGFDDLFDTELSNSTGKKE
jgi:hypothetical protein